MLSTPSSRIAFLVFLPLLGGAAPALRPVEVRLASERRALVPVVVGKDASTRVRSAAGKLAGYLGRITQARFEVTVGDGRTGLAVGRAKDFPALAIRTPGDGTDPRRSEDYLLESHAKGVYLIGASDQAVEHAVWDLLYRIGHRQFFPGPTWEVLPSISELRVALHAFQQPSYHARRIWYGYGAAPWSASHYADWCEKNRATGGIALSSGHAYDGIIRRNRSLFDRHPEYLGLRAGKRDSSKICIGNPDVRKLVVADALKQFDANPGQQSYSVDPSDGGGWCECPKCRALGSVSDRALTLANEVATGVASKHAGKFIGMYAYSEHSPPPSIRVHPQVVISVATAFIRGGFTSDQLLAGWQAQGATLGIREYFSVNVWDRDLPGKPRAARLAYLAEKIPHFHARGARFFSAESSDNWGPCGLGYHVAARILWDVTEARRVQHLRDDFLTRAFGPARIPMGRFYALIDGDNRPLLTDDLLGRMYRELSDARKATRDPHIRARIADLVLYTRYVESWLDYASATGAERQKAFETLLRHAYRMRGTLMIHVLGLARDLPRRDRGLTLPSDAGPRVPVGKNPWMSDRPFADEEIAGLIDKGLATRKRFDFTPRSFSDDLVPATPLRLSDGKPGTLGTYSRGVRHYHTWIERAPATLEMKVTGGRVYLNRGDVKVGLYPRAEEEGKAVASAQVPGDRKEHAIRLRTTYEGLHRLELADQSAGTVITWPEGLARTVVSSPEQPVALPGRWTSYFYVPRGTRQVGGYSSGPGTMVDGSGKTVHTFTSRPGYFSVPVAAGQDGRLWKFDRCVGQKLLMTVPPCLAASAKELLLPVEVVRKDTVGK